MQEEIVRHGITIRRIGQSIEEGVVMPEFVPDIGGDDLDVAVADAVDTRQWLTPLVLLGYQLSKGLFKFAQCIAHRA